MSRGRSGFVLEIFALQLTQLGCQAHIIGFMTALSGQPDDEFYVASASRKTENVFLIAEPTGLVGAKSILISTRTGEKLSQQADVRLLFPR